MTGLLFNPRDPTLVADPYPHYRTLREQDPVHRSPVGAWFLARHEDARTVLREPRFRVRDIPRQIANKSRILKETRLFEGQPEDLEGLIDNARYWLSFLDGEPHSRIRKLTVQAFSAKAVERIRAEVRGCARALLERALRAAEIDIMRDLARPLPSLVIGRLLGIGDETLCTLVPLTDRISRIFDPLMSLADYGHIDRAAREFSACLEALIVHRRADPGDDLISALTLAKDDGGGLSDHELVSTCTLLFCAGSETTVNLIGNGVLALARHPDAFETLRGHPELLPAAIEEFLRYDAPLQMTSRHAVQDLEIGGKSIHAGDQVFAIIGAANRDPEVFDHPDRLDFARPRNPHLSFAVGHHMCLGAILARMEAQEAFATLLESCSALKLADDGVRWRNHLVLRGLESLRIRCTRA